MLHSRHDNIDRLLVLQESIMEAAGAKQAAIDTWHKAADAMLHAQGQGWTASHPETQKALKAWSAANKELENHDVDREAMEKEAYKRHEARVERRGETDSDQVYRARKGPDRPAPAPEPDFSNRGWGPGFARPARVAPKQRGQMPPRTPAPSRQYREAPKREAPNTDFANKTTFRSIRVNAERAMKALRSPRTLSAMSGHRTFVPVRPDEPKGGRE